MTGLDRRDKSELEGEKKAREDVLTSVQGEVEAMTGGRRMAEVLDVCQEELDRHVTPTGRPKAGSAYAAAIEARDRLVNEASRLQTVVGELHDALRERRDHRARLADIELPEAIEERGKAVVDAEAALAAAKAHGEAFRQAEIETKLRRSEMESARSELSSYRDWLSRGEERRARRTEAIARRNDASARKERLDLDAAAKRQALEAAEIALQSARQDLDRIERGTRARDAVERLGKLRDQLARAEAITVSIGAKGAELLVIGVPADTLSALEKLEIEIAGQRAAEAAKSTSVRIDYQPGATGAAMIDGVSLGNGETRVLSISTRLELAGIGTLTVSPGARAATEGLAANEEKRRKLLERIGATNVEAARERDAMARQRKAELEQERRDLAWLAPHGMAAIREAIARLEQVDMTDVDVAGDLAEARSAFELAERGLAECAAADRSIRPAREEALEAMADASAELAVAESELAAADTALGPEAGRAGREASLADAAARLEAPLAEVELRLAGLAAAVTDIESAEAALRRATSVRDAATEEARRLNLELAGLSGQISTRSEDAIEERLRETEGLRDAAIAELARFEREVALLTRLRAALDAARNAAREHYFEPVMRELRPLLGLLFEDASVVFDDASLLPRTVERSGQIEEVERLSGGMREQLAVLTRLAFTRLLARNGRPTPVILDDALVYSDDDRIERIFDALHRQSRDQQIIVFSCRQRAFSRLGGNALHLTEWTPTAA